MDIREKMKRDWDRRAEADPYYWVAATEDADLQSYQDSALNDTQNFLEGLAPHRTNDRGKVLDLGCGIGRMTSLLTPHFDEVFGVDVSEHMINTARSIHSKVNNLHFATNSGADLSAFETESIDVVCSYSVLAHLPSDVVQAYFQEVGRALKVDGLFRYQFWVGPEMHPSDDNTLSIHVYDEKHLAHLHEVAGLQECARDEIDYFDPILKLKPVWITARKVRHGTQAVSIDREVSDTPSEEEAVMEYDLLIYLASKHSDRGERAEAEAILERASHFQPKREEAYLHWAALRLESDDLKGALLLLEALTTVCPTSMEGWLFRAQASMAEDDLANAQVYLGRAAQIVNDVAPELQAFYHQLLEELQTVLSVTPTKIDRTPTKTGKPRLRHSKKRKRK